MTPTKFVRGVGVSELRENEVFERERELKMARIRGMVTG